VNLPQVTQKDKIAPLLDAYGQTFNRAQRATGVLNYKGFSVVMTKERRFAFYSAANVDGGMRPMISGRDDNWLFDERIERDFQVDNSFYKEMGGKKNRFDRGHLTRRDDMEWGVDPVDAVNRANGTCTWTNCAAQHEVFNQGKDKSVLLWQNLEKYILEKSAAFHQFRVQVITGPIFGGADPEYRGVAYPLEYWKVVAAVTDRGKLFATGYILGQKETIDKYGLEAAVEEPFGEFGAYQRPIGIIENVTGLRFTYGPDSKPLSDVDPLAKPSWRPRRSRGGGGAQESFGAGDDDALRGFEDIVLA
jgi:endonuclease G